MPKRATLAQQIFSSLKNNSEEEASKCAGEYLKLLERDTQRAILDVNILQCLCGDDRFSLQSSNKNPHQPPSNDVQKKDEVVCPSQKATTTTRGSTKSDSVKKNKEVHVGRLKLVVGKITSIEKHPNADSLYVETVDIGQPKTLTVCSGLVDRVPLEQLDGNTFIFCCNLKAVKMRGVVSEAMLMCACDGTGVEPLQPPPDTCLGDRVVCAAYDCEPDPVLNPKEKVWETVQPELKVDECGVATYRGEPLCVGLLGAVMTKLLKSCKIS